MPFFSYFRCNFWRSRESSFPSSYPSAYSNSVSSLTTATSASCSPDHPTQSMNITKSPFINDFIHTLKIRKGDANELTFTLEEVSEAIDKLYKKREGKKKNYFLIGFIFLLIFTCFAFSTISVIFAIKWIKEERVNDSDVLVNAKDGNPLRVQEYYSYIPIDAMRWIEFDKIEKIESLFLQWGTEEEQNEKNFYFKVLSAFKDGKNKTITIYLSSNYKLILFESIAILYNENNEEVGKLRISPLLNKEEKGNNETKDSTLSSIPLSFTKDNSTRRLGALKQLLMDTGVGRYPFNADAGPPLSGIDNYCRYGCGGLAVTFPYYYRPFFGYGYPLVGTESMFPAGYGGYPAAPILASQVGNIPQINNARSFVNGGTARTFQAGQNPLGVNLNIP